MSFLGWSVIFEESDVIGFKSQKNGDLWLVESSKEEKQDYDEVGTNHISIRVESQIDIDDATKYLKQNKTDTLFGTPRHRPEFSLGEHETYYQIMFESPDKVLFEIVYIGAKTLI